ncbi:helix-turn-helix domain-containing protein [Mycobacterium intracellulare]|uniref:helix-turn-helix domain-containing protein n=1 Tax=Mycobacterium intracellulare TaxID=1767 RepID=UPI0034D4C132
MNASLEARIAQRITADGSVIVSPRIARWLEQKSGMTADRRMRLYFSDPEAYEVLSALHAVSRSDCGTEQVAGQRDTEHSTVWMSTGEVAKALDVSDRCIRKWCRSGRLRAVQVGSRWLIEPNALALSKIA